MPDEVKKHMVDVCKKLEEKETAWNNMFKEYCEKYPVMINPKAKLLMDEVLVAILKKNFVEQLESER